MQKKPRQYSLNRRIILFYLIPIVFLVSVLFLYTRFYHANVETMAETTFNSIVELKHRQVEANLDELRSITKEIVYSSHLQQYLIKTNESEKIQTYANFQNYLRTISAHSPSIISAYANLDGYSRVHTADGSLYIFEDEQNELDLVNRLNKNTEHFTGLKSLPGFAAGHQYSMYFFVGAPIHAGSAYKNSRMIGGIIYDPSKLLEADENMQDHIAVYLLKGEPVFLSGTLSPEQLDTLLGMRKNQIKLDGVQYFCHQSPLLNQNDMQLLYLVPRESLIQHAGFLEQQSLIFIVLAAVVLSISVVLILQTIFLPIRQLCHEVDALKNYGEKLSEPRAKELSSITDTYNAMSQRISESIQQEKQMVEKQYQLEIQKNRMEMRAFRNQINPHFLFNTLECLNGMVRYYHLEPVSDLITNLSGCFHYSLYSPMTVNLSEELGHLSNYLKIIETRFPGKYRIIYRIDPALETVPVPSLLLQPLAENAVTHAFRGYAKKVRPTIMLQIRPDEANKFLIIHMTDNGIGMDEAKLAKVLETAHSTDYAEKHISLNNVHRRLMLLYGENCMQIVSRSGYYTSISVRIPLKHPVTAPLNDDTNLA